MQIGRLIYSARYYRPGQILGRAYRRIKQWLTRPIPYESANEVAFRLPNQWPLAGESGLNQPKLTVSADKVSVTLLGQTRSCPLPFDWVELDRAAPSRLWRFQLHYHEHLLSFLQSDFDLFEKKAEQVWQLILNWIEVYSGRNSPLRSWKVDAWHPYVISRRVPVWLQFLCKNPPPDEFRSVIFRSLVSQIRLLRSNLEYDLGGNHLLQNLRALALAGACFGGSEAAEWHGFSLRTLQREVAEQILPHGEHLERSPMYHIDILHGLLEVYAIAGPMQPAIREWLGDAIRRTSEFLQTILHPDGNIPLLGDSVHGQAPEPQRLLEESWRLLGETAANRALPYPVARGVQPSPAGATVVGDSWVFRSGGDFLIFDAGPVGPDNLPAHAHADLLGLEASVGGMRFIVDTGVSDYEDSATRAYCRSTAAHSVLEIDGKNQCDVWSRFRMGRRGWPGKLRCGQTGPFCWAWCTHNAYRHRGIPEVGRLVACNAEGAWVIFDWAMGTGLHTFRNRLHLAPAAVPQVCNQLVGLQLPGGERALKVVGNGRLRTEKTPYWPEFGKAQVRFTIVFEAEDRAPYSCAWVIAQPKLLPQVELSWHNGRPRVLIGHGQQRWELTAG